MNDSKFKQWEESRDLGQELLQAVKEMKSDKAARTHHVSVTMATEARLKIGLSQSAFAQLIGVSKRTLQEWEQGRREPSGAAKTLLKVASIHPEVMQELIA